MKVFEVCLLVIKRRFATFVVYFTIFIALSIVITTLTSDQFSPDFSAMKPNFTVINRDGMSPLADGLVAFLRENGSEVILEDEKSVLQDATFYRATDYIVFLPHGFRDSVLSGAPITLDTVKTTHSANGYFTDSMMNQYLNQVRFYLAAGGGLSEHELVEAVRRDLTLSASAEKIRFGASAPVDLNYMMYNQIQCYILLVLIILCVTNITMVFRRPDIRMRNLCSPLRPRSMSFQQMLCSAVLSLIAWVLITVVGFILYGANLGGVDGRIIALITINTLVFTIVALSVAALSGTFVRSSNSQNAAANILTLGLCFLGGVFVPLEMLGDGMLSVARFLPTYWNVTALERIYLLTSFGSETMTPIWQAMAIQLAFAAAILCITLVLSKYLNQSEHSFGSVKTEIDA